MKKIFSFMMMALMICATSVFNNAYADSPDCEFWMIGIDQSGDGWDGNGQVLIQQDGQADQTFRVENQTYAARIGFIENKEMTFTWKNGDESYNSENSLIICSPAGTKYFPAGSWTTGIDGKVIFSIPANTPCPTDEQRLKINDAVVNADNTITLNWQWNDNENPVAYFQYFIISSTGQVITGGIEYSNTATIGPADKSGEYTILLLAMKDGENVIESASKTQDITLNTLGDVNIKLLIHKDMGAPEDLRFYIFYRTYDDLAVQNSIQLTKNGDWWTGTITDFPATKMYISCYYTSADDQICTNQSDLGNDPYKYYTKDDNIINFENKDNCCFELLTNSSLDYVLESVDCNMPIKDRIPKDLKTTVTDGKVVFSWTPVDDADSYRISASTETEGTITKTAKENTFTWFPVSDTDFQLYNWNVTPVRNSLYIVNIFLAPAITDAVTVPASTPLIPINILPNYDSHTKKLTVTWEKVTDATYYWVEVRNSSDALKLSGSTIDNSIEFDAKNLENDTYTVKVQPRYYDENGQQAMAKAGEASITTTMEPLGDVEVNVLIPSDCRAKDVDFDISKNIYLYYYSTADMKWYKIAATDKGGRWYSFNFNTELDLNVNAQIANEELDDATLVNPTLTFASGTDVTPEFNIYRSTCLELVGTTTEHSFNQKEIDCDATDHDYLPRNLRADYETPGRAHFTWKTNSGVDHYTIQITTEEVLLPTKEVTTPAYTFVADQVYHVKKWTVISYDADNHILASVTKNEEFTIQLGTANLKASDLNVTTTDGKNFTFSWKPAQNAASYLVQVGRNSYYYYDNYLRNIDSYDNGISLVTTDTCVTHPLYLKGTWYWRVYSVDKDGIKTAYADGPTFGNVKENAEFTFTNIQTRLDKNKLTISWETNAPGANIYISNVIDTYTEAKSITIPISKGGWIDWTLYAAEKDDLGNWRYFYPVESGKVFVDPEYNFLKYYDVSLTATVGGSVTGAGKYAEGENATIRAIADKGYVFEQWSDGDKNATRTITVTKNIMLQAVFRTAQQFSISISVEPSEGGFVKVNDTKTTNEKVYEGTTITLEAVANSGYQFKEWKIDGAREGSNPTLSFSPKASAAIVAVFEVMNGLDDIDNENYTIQQSENRLTVTAKQTTRIALYNAAGQLIAQTNAAQAQFTLPTAGIYILHIGNKAVKLVK